MDATRRGAIAARRETVRHPVAARSGRWSSTTPAAGWWRSAAGAGFAIGVTPATGWWRSAAGAAAIGVACSGCALIAGVEDAELDPTVTGVGGGSTGTLATTGTTAPGPGGTGGGGTGASSGDGGGTGASSGDGGGVTTSTGDGGAGTGGESGAGGAGGAGSTGVGGAGGGGGGGDACPGPVAGMVEIPAGPFMMGCNSGVDEMCSADENPYHEVTVGCFLMDRYEVTRGDYLACVDAGACDAPEMDWDPAGQALQDHPVTWVTWEMASTYCTWADKRLPTEAEWEKAARGTEGLKYPFGNIWGDGTPGGGDCTQANANLCRKDTAPVTSSPTGVSPYGLFHMGGNVSEWVADWYSASYYATSPDVDPTGPASGGVRGKRGGSWNSPIFDFRTSAREAGVPDVIDADEGYETGFRCAK